MSKFWRALTEWRWWLVLPYVLLFILPIACLIELGKWLDSHSDTVVKPMRWALFYLRKSP